MNIELLLTAATYHRLFNSKKKIAGLSLSAIIELPITNPLGALTKKKNG